MKHSLPGRTLRWLAPLIAALLTLPALGQSETLWERYYVVELAGQRAGWMHGRHSRVGEEIVSEVEMRFEIKRGETGVKIAMQSTFVETEDHKPIRMASTQQLAALPISTRVVFGAESMEVTTESAGAASTQTMPLPEGEWLTPGGADEYLRRRLEAGAESITIRSLDPLAGVRPVTTTYEGLAKERIEVFGREVEAIRATITTSEMAGLETTEYMDEKGRMLRSSTNLGGIEMALLAADRDLALSDLDAPELMQSTFVEPRGKIRRPRDAERAEYLLRVADGKLEDLPTLPAQTPTRVDDRTIRLAVTMGEDAPKESAPGPEYLEASSMIDTQDPLIRELAAGAIPGENAPPQIAAEALRRFVFDHIDEKGLGVGMGSASEVARSCTGDCSEHGTLLAALLRTQGIPARVVSGLVYVNDFEGSKDIFGYHMWTQAWLELEPGKPQWVDYDATLGPYGRFDATHIALAVSAMSDHETTNSMLALVPLLGRLEIEIVSTE